MEGRSLYLRQQFPIKLDWTATVDKVQGVIVNELVCCTETLLDQVMIYSMANFQKMFDDGQYGPMRYGLCFIQGHRHEMEDTHAIFMQLPDSSLSSSSYFGVFDGHNGSKAAIRASQYLHKYIIQALNSTAPNNEQGIIEGLKRAHIKFDHDLRMEAKKANDNDDSGSTSISCLIHRNKIYLMNLGDSRALIVAPSGNIVVQTKDHKPTDPMEMSRIQQAGGQVHQGRINGVIGLSRAFGNFLFKSNTRLAQDQQMIIAKPDIYLYSQIHYPAFIVLGSDGIFDCVSNEQLTSFIISRLRSTNHLSDICRDILDLCLRSGSLDNMTVILITFSSPKQDYNPQDQQPLVRRNSQLSAPSVNFNTNPYYQAPETLPLSPLNYPENFQDYSHRVGLFQSSSESLIPQIINIDKINENVQRPPLFQRTLSPPFFQRTLSSPLYRRTLSPPIRPGPAFDLFQGFPN
ncbi:unnamed protein product [Didymodactylos carnosus]|uniref:protein-serine/threonine phosphatase n=1 Tax=Didymodactylos carnosus TaxID=1234261 RepID=A0A814MYC9_9BILA|nr:unnamed protein product [Didymodactylos carnosus]CAF1088252.1 unnamed protein product [Didymodactylos carnosus]CAF3848754.1 unnamed protein product [Didymodactylos carnosus]CAF3850007.1 unnamed protein product [Didymodactylos carnosus]